MKLAPSFPYRIALTGFFGLFVLLMLWNTALTTAPKLPVALRGFLNVQLKSCAWLAYVSLIYFIHGCSEAYANAAVRPYAMLEIVLSLMIFLGTTFYIRLSGRQG